MAFFTPFTRLSHSFGTQVSTKIASNKQPPKAPQNFSTRGSPATLPAYDRARIDIKLSRKLLL